MTNIGYAAGETIKGSTRFMTELIPSILIETFTGGLAPSSLDMQIVKEVGKLGVKESVKRMATDAAFKKVVTTSFKNIAKKEAKLLATQFITTAPLNIYSKTAQRMIGYIDLETGTVVDEGQSLKEALINSTTEHAVELLTERTGGVLTKKFI